VLLDKRAQSASTVILINHNWPPQKSEIFPLCVSPRWFFIFDNPWEL